MYARPGNTFLNWTVLDMGAFDAAESGTSPMARRRNGSGLVDRRAGVQLSQIPNGEVINGDLWGWGKDQIGIGGVLYGSGRIAM